jgi:hypothetical protein
MMQHRRRWVAASLAISLAAGIGAAEVSRAADECLTKPNTLAPQGSHWYYRIDRTTHRQCWFLGVERGKGQAYAARQDSVPVRPHPSKMTTHAKPQAPASTITADAAGEGPLAAEAAAVKLQAPAQTTTTEATGEGPLPANAVPVEITLFQAKPSEGNSTAGVAFSSAIRTSMLSIDSGSEVRNSYTEEQPTKGPEAEEQSTKEAEEEMPLVWPILSDEELSTAARPPDSPISFAQICAALAVVLGLAAIGRLIFKLSACCKPNQFRSDRHAVRTVDTRRRDEHVPPTFARTTAAARQARMTCRMGKASSSDSVANLEPSVRRLLHELERRRFCAGPSF